MGQNSPAVFPEQMQSSRARCCSVPCNRRGFCLMSDCLKPHLPSGVNQGLPSSSLTHQIFLSTPSSLRACTGLDIFACEEKASLELPLVAGGDVPAAGGVPPAEGVCSREASPPLLTGQQLWHSGFWEKIHTLLMRAQTDERWQRRMFHFRVSERKQLND